MDGNQEVVKPMTIVQFKMENVCSLCKVIFKKLSKKNNLDRKRRALYSFQAPNGIDTIV
jgi:hypothetical protein